MNNIKKIIEYGLYLLVFLLPWQTRWIIKAGELNNGYWEYGTVSLYATDVLLLIILLLFVISFYFTKELGIRNPSNQAGRQELGGKSQIPNSKFQIPTYWWIIAGLELMIFISIFVAPDKLLAIYRYFVFLLGIGLFWLITQASYNRVKLILSFLASILIQAGLGVWQFLSQSSFSTKWLGMAMHRAGDLGTSVVEIIGADGMGERWLRAYGGLDHPNTLGGVLVVGVLLIVLYIINSKSEIPNPKQTQNSPTKADQPMAEKFKIFFWIMIIVFILGLFFSFSRGAWLGLVVGLVVIFILLLWKRDLSGQKNFFELLLVGGILVFLLFNLYGGLANTRLKSDSRLEKKSYVERISSIRDAKEIIKDQWLFGEGIGNYTLGVYNNEEKYRPSFYFQPVHNVFLLVWAEIGIFGLFSFISLLLVTCYLLLKNYKHKNNFRIYQLGLLAAIFVMFMVDHWWWSLHFGVLFFWFTLGLILREKELV